MWFFYPLTVVNKRCLEFERAAIPCCLSLGTLYNLVVGLPPATFVVLKPLIMALKVSAQGKVVYYLPQVLWTLIHLGQDVVCE